MSINADVPKFDVRSYYLNPELSDLIFSFPSSSTQVFAHRLVLAAQSRLFHEYFVNLSSSTAHKFPIKIIIKDISIQLFQDLLHYFYFQTIKLETRANPIEYYGHFFKLATHYQVFPLIHVLKEKLIELIQDTSTFDDKVLQLLHQLDQLKPTSSDIIRLAVAEIEQAIDQVITTSDNVTFTQVLHSKTSLLAQFPTDRLISICNLRSQGTHNQPLLLAIEYQFTSIIPLLLSSHQEPEKECLVLQKALESGNPLIIRQILGQTEEDLSAVAFTYLHLATKQGKLAYVRYLVEATDWETDANDLSCSHTPFQVACEHGHQQIVEYLLQHAAADPCLCDPMLENTAFHDAAMTNSVATMQTLASHCQDRLDEILNKQNNRGQTCLHVAIQHHELTMTHFLIGLGANPTMIDDQGQNALHHAAAIGEANIVLVLLKCNENLIERRQEREKQRKEDENQEERDEDLGNEELIFQVNATDAKGNTALHLAAMATSGWEKTLVILLENQAQPNLLNWFQQTALHLFCAYQDGPSSLISLFLEHGVDLHVQATDGSTALHLAVGRLASGSFANASTDIMIALVRNGAQLHYEDCAGRTVVELVETLHQGKLVVPLLRNVATPPQWVPDENVTACASCKVGFTIAMRKHHCRHCGRIVCYNCSRESIAIPKFDMSKPVRVCQACFEVLSFNRLM